MMRELLLREWSLYPSLIPFSSGGQRQAAWQERHNKTKTASLPATRLSERRRTEHCSLFTFSTSAWEVKMFESCPQSTTNEVSEKGLRDSWVT